MQAGLEPIHTHKLTEQCLTLIDVTTHSHVLSCSRAPVPHSLNTGVFNSSGALASDTLASGALASVVLASGVPVVRLGHLVSLNVAVFGGSDLSSI